MAVYTGGIHRFHGGMIERISRRLSLKFFSVAALLGLFGKRPAVAQGKKAKLKRLDRWDKTHDRIFLGGDFWANPMEDWTIKDGWAECMTDSANRSIHSLTHQIAEPGKGFAMSVKVGRSRTAKKDGGAGFRLGVKSDINEVKSNVFAGGGVNAGLVGQELFIGKKKAKLTGALDGDVVILELEGAASGDQVELTFTAKSWDGAEELGKVTAKAGTDSLIGNIALVSQYTGAKGRTEGVLGHRFTDWQVGGDAFTVKPEQAFGPILWSMYTLSDSRSDEGFVMKISALLGPVGEKDNREVDLEVQRNGQWESLGSETLDPAAWVSTWRIPNWNETVDTPFRLVYREQLKDGREVPAEWTGKIRQNPVGRPVRIGGLTCQKDYAFPYEPVANNLVNLDPDLLFFSGDQLYENHGGFGIIRDVQARVKST